VAAAQDTLATVFSEHRTHLVAVAYRLTSSLADAEDAVQEAWLRLANLTDRSRAEIRDLRGWLTTVVGRICLDRLRSAAVRRERYVGQWLPEPLVTPLSGARADDPLDLVVRDDGVRLAALVVLDRLSPEQRVALVLHDAFAVPFTEIAEALDCSVAAARQHASRGRKAAAEADPPPRVELAEHREVVERFLAALASGDVNAVLQVLHPDAVLVGDSGGKARTAPNIILGADKVARFALGLMQKYGVSDLGTAAEASVGVHPVLVNGDFGVLLDANDALRIPLQRRVTGFAVRDGRIVAIYDVVNPDKLVSLR
jgi:RNA polymerase sigma-70 factor (ECF subfamily)